MGNTVDFNKLRKKRQRGHRIKQMIFLAGIAALAVVGIYLSDLLVDSNVSTKLSDLAASFGGAGYPVGLPGGVIRDVGDLGGNQVILNDAGLYIYNKKGKLINSFQQMTGRTVLETKKDRALLYDVGGRKLEIHSPTKTLHTNNLDDMLVYADIGLGGGYVTVTTPKQYVAQVTAYDARFEWLFTWYSSEYMVSGAALSPKGNMMSVSCVDSSGGVLESVIYLFKFNVKQEIAQIRLTDELVVDIDFVGDSRINILTERGFYVYDSEGNRIGHYSLPALPLTAFESNGLETLVLCGDRGQGTQTLVLLDGQASEKAASRIEDKLLDIALGSGKIYILADSRITVYNQRLEPQQEYELPEARLLSLVAGRLYYLTRSEIYLLEE